MISYTRKINLIIEERSAENIKMKIGAVGDIEELTCMEVRGGIN
ncbi:hypothetical protein [Sporosarcina ureae]|nr:hypothetical protein [Sporosarcina ureae]